MTIVDIPTPKRNIKQIAKSALHKNVVQTSVSLLAKTRLIARNVVHQFISAVATIPSGATSVALSARNVVLAHITKKIRISAILMLRVRNTFQKLLMGPDWGRLIVYDFEEIQEILKSWVETVSDKWIHTDADFWKPVEILLSVKNVILQHISEIKTVRVALKIRNVIIQHIGSKANDFKRLMILNNTILQHIVARANDFKIRMTLKNVILQTISNRASAGLQYVFSMKNAIIQVIQGVAEVNWKFNVRDALIDTLQRWDKFIVEDVVLIRIHITILTVLNAIIQQVAQKTTSILHILLLKTRNAIHQIVGQKTATWISVFWIAVKSGISQSISNVPRLSRHSLYRGRNAIVQGITQIAQAPLRARIINAKNAIHQNITNKFTVLWHRLVFARNTISQVVTQFGSVNIHFLAKARSALIQPIAKHISIRVSVVTEKLISAVNIIFQHIAQRQTVLWHIKAFAKSAISRHFVEKLPMVSAHWLVRVKSALHQNITNRTVVLRAIVLAGVKSTISQNIVNTGNVLQHKIINAKDGISQNIVNAIVITRHMIFTAKTVILQTIAYKPIIYLGYVLLSVKNAIIQMVSVTSIVRINWIIVRSAIMQAIATRPRLPIKMFIRTAETYYGTFTRKVNTFLSWVGYIFGLKTFTSDSAPHYFATASVGYNYYSAQKEGYYFVTKTT